MGIRRLFRRNLQGAVSCLFPCTAGLQGTGISWVSPSTWVMLPARTFWIMLDKLCGSSECPALACPVGVHLREYLLAQEELGLTQVQQDG